MVSMRRLLMIALLVATTGLAACRRPEPKPPKPARVPVTSEVVAAAPFQARVDLLGRVVPAARIEIRPPMAGRIRYAPAFSGGLRTGRAVRRGEPIFHIESPELDLKLSEARLAARAARAELDRAQKGVEAGILPRAELEAREIEADLAEERLAGARAEHERLRYVAPADGTLNVQRSLVDGTEVSPDQLLADLAGEGATRVEAWVPAGELDRLDLGYSVECLLPRASRRVGVGTLVEIAQEIEDGGVARAVVEIEQDLGMPRFGEGVELQVLLPEKPEALTVPRRSVLVSGRVSSVFVLEKVGQALEAEVRLVQTGGLDGDRVEILDGIQAGERVAVEGAEYLADGLMAEDVDLAKKRGKKKGRS